MTEAWKPVVGWETAYEVSDLGRVRSLDRTTNRGNRIEGRIRKPQLLPTGYLYVALKCNGRKANAYVHRMVAEAFIGPHREGFFINHRSGVKTDNRLENLEWVTRSENMLHAIENGLLSVTLSDEQVREIRRRYKAGGTYGRIGKALGVSRAIVSSVITGLCYDRVEGEKDFELRGNRGARHLTPLTEDDVREIKRRLAAGESQPSIAADFPVTRGTIGNIHRGVTWAHVE